MNVTQLQYRRDELKRQLDRRERERDEASALVAEIKLDLAALERSTTSRDPFEAELRRKRDLAVSLVQIDNGITNEDPIEPRLAPLLNRRGLRALNAAIEQLKAEIESIDAELVADPNEKVLCRLYRKARHYDETGRALNVGDHAMLTRRQLAMLADRFELLSSEAERVS